MVITSILQITDGKKSYLQKHKTNESDVISKHLQMGFEPESDTYSIP